MNKKARYILKAIDDLISELDDIGDAEDAPWAITQAYAPWYAKEQLERVRKRILDILGR